MKNGSPISAIATRNPSNTSQSATVQHVSSRLGASPGPATRKTEPADKAAWSQQLNWSAVLDISVWFDCSSGRTVASAKTAGIGRKCSRNRNGLSLLEVILSIAILGGSMVVIGHMYNLGYRSALQAQFRSEANLLADSKMAELAAGVLPTESTGDSEIEGSPGWQYAIEIEDSFQPGLFIATVTVKKGEESSVVPDGLSIVRFLPDPDYEAEEDEE